MLIKDGKEYYPVDYGTILKDGKTYYTRHSRDKPYFYLILRTQEQVPAPAPSNP